MLQPPVHTSTAVPVVTWDAAPLIFCREIPHRHSLLMWVIYASTICCLTHDFHLRSLPIASSLCTRAHFHSGMTMPRSYTNDKSLVNTPLIFNVCFHTTHATEPCVFAKHVRWPCVCLALCAFCAGATHWYMLVLLHHSHVFANGRDVIVLTFTTPRIASVPLP